MNERSIQEKKHILSQLMAEVNVLCSEYFKNKNYGSSLDSRACEWVEKEYRFIVQDSSDKRLEFLEIKTGDTIVFDVDHHNFVEQDDMSEGPLAVLYGYIGPSIFRSIVPQEVIDRFETLETKKFLDDLLKEPLK